MERRRRIRTTITAATLAALGSGVAGAAFEARSIDGSGNNVINPQWGAVGEQLMRMTSVWYADEMQAPAGEDRPNPRAVSNAVCQQGELTVNAAHATDFLWQWGQFIDHDITLVDLALPLEPFDIPVPMGDPFFDPDGTGTQVIHLERSAYDPMTGGDPSTPRQQIEFITAYVDGSQVYGSDIARAVALRTMDGTGRLKTSDGNLLPFNLLGLPNLGGEDSSLFLAGDIRANEQVGLTSMHTLWVREHNRVAAMIRSMQPWLPGDEVFELARAIVGAEIQVITYREFLPLLLGPDAIPPYGGYRADVDPSIANIFATAAYRVGHTLLSPMLRRIDADGNEIAAGHLALRDAFFAVDEVIDHGIEPILRGLASQQAQAVDARIIDDVRNFLFGQPGQGGFDLAALNMQRGRDHGLPGYNRTREDLDLAPVDGFDQITSDPDIQAALASVYDDVDQVDLWVGALAEDHVEGAMVGELIRKIVGDQFTRLRDGDRFWYENQFDGLALMFLESVRLSDVIRANTTIDAEIQNDAFRMPFICDGDVDQDGLVNVTDVVLVLAAWGDAGGAADVDDSGLVDMDDLLYVLFRFGPCAAGATAPTADVDLREAIEAWLGGGRSTARRH